ncbi:MAG: hypothetical protein OXS40_06105 [Gammaproteobacteria bacterium]|nr:hypothetical protein [Gammaproteobacteria bacterium]
MSFTSISRTVSAWVTPALVVGMFIYLNDQASDTRSEMFKYHREALDRISGIDERMAHLEGLFEGYISRPVAATDDSAGQPVQ